MYQWSWTSGALCRVDQEPAHAGGLVGAACCPGQRSDSRFPRFPGFAGKRGLPDSRLGRNRETGNPRFPIRPGPGIGVPMAAGRGFPGLTLAATQWLELEDVAPLDLPWAAGPGSLAGRGDHWHLGLTT